MEDMHAYLSRSGFLPKGKEVKIGSYSLAIGNDLAITSREGRLSHYRLDSCMSIVSEGHDGEQLMPILGYNEETLRGFLDVPQNAVVAVVYKGEFYVKEQQDTKRRTR